MQLLEVAFVLALLAPVVIGVPLMLSRVSPSVDDWLDERHGHWLFWSAIEIWTCAAVLGVVGWSAL